MFACFPAFADTAGMMASVTQRWRSPLYLLVFASTLTLGLGVLSVAPDDFVSSCTTHAEPGSFNNPNQKVLLDTQFYESSDLLTIKGEDGLWISLDFDMTTGDGFGKVRKHESEQEGNRESVRACECMRCIVVPVRCSGVIRPRVRHVHTDC